MFKAVKRGRLHQVALAASGEPVDIKLYGCRVQRPPYLSNGKTYMLLDLGACVAGSGTELLRAVDEFVARQAKPSFTPVRADGALLVKLDRPKYEDGNGDPGPAFQPAPNDLVDVVVRPGAFAAFGYCVLVHRMKPHALLARG